MKKDKITILVSGFIGVLIAGFAFYNPVEAADASVYVSPASLNKNVGDVFDISVKVNPAGEKVCAVEGNLNLDKLSCQNITVGQGIMAQSPPSCSNLYFLLGIPGCSTENKTLFTITVKAENVGTATAGFTGIDIIGEGASVSSGWSGGSYSLVIPETVLPPSCNCDNWSSWQKGDCGGGDCVSTQVIQSRARACEPAGCDAEKENRCIDDVSCVSLVPSITETEKEGTEEMPEAIESQEELEIVKTILPEPKPSFLASISAFFTEITVARLVFYFVSIVVIVSIAMFFIRKKKKSFSQNNK